jgi:hypothetical protein
LLREKTLAETYDSCIAEGYLQDRDQVEIGKVNTNLVLSESFLKGASAVPEKDTESPKYILYYDALHLLVEALLVFDKVKSNNHQCLFAYICVKYPELELDWNFLERIRVRRNGILYYGSPITAQQFKEDEMGFKLYTSLLRKEIKKRQASQE